MIFIYQETLTLTNSMIITSLPSRSTYFRRGAYLKFWLKEEALIGRRALSQVGGAPKCYFLLAKSFKEKQKLQHLIHVNVKLMLFWKQWLVIKHTVGVSVKCGVWVYLFFFKESCFPSPGCFRVRVEIRYACLYKISIISSSSLSSSPPNGHYLINKVSIITGFPCIPTISNKVKFRQNMCEKNLIN